MVKKRLEKLSKDKYLIPNISQAQHPSQIFNTFASISTNLNNRSIQYFRKKQYDLYM